MVRRSRTPKRRDYNEIQTDSRKERKVARGDWKTRGCERKKEREREVFEKMPSKPTDATPDTIRIHKSIQNGMNLRRGAYSSTAFFSFFLFVPRSVYRFIFSFSCRSFRFGLNPYSLPKFGRSNSAGIASLTLPTARHLQVRAANPVRLNRSTMKPAPPQRRLLIHTSGAYIGRTHSRAFLRSV